jgi:Flp pilus assembly protein TadD
LYTVCKLFRIEETSIFGKGRRISCLAETSRLYREFAMTAMIRNFYRIGAIASIIVGASVLTASGQDLGSSNRLFRGGKRTPVVTEKSAAAAKAAAEKKPAEKKPVEKKPVEKKAEAKPRTEPVARKIVPRKPKPAATAKARQKVPSRSTSARRKAVTTTKPSDTQAVIAPTPAVIADRRRSGRDRVAPVASSIVERNTTVISITPSGVSKRTGTKVSKAVPAGTSSSQLEQILRQAEDALDTGNDVRAEGLYERARQMRPSDARIYRGLAAIYERQKRLEDAEKAYRELAKADTNDAETMVRLSRLLLRPVSAPNLGERYEEAEKLARRAASLSPRNAAANVLLARAMELRGELGYETEAAYRASISIDPRSAVSYAYLGRLMRTRGRTAEANRYFKEAVERAGDPASQVEVAEVLLGENRAEDAIQLLDEAVARDRRNITALNLLGRALTAVGNFAEAERTFRRSIDANVANFGAYNSLAALYIRKGDFGAASSALSNAVRFASGFEKRRLATQFEIVGDGFSRSGRTNEARIAYRQAASLDPDRETLTGKIARVR